MNLLFFSPDYYLKWDVDESGLSASERRELSDAEALERLTDRLERARAKRAKLDSLERAGDALEAEHLHETLMEEEVSAPPIGKCLFSGQNFKN